jgi:hypothetical protein
MKTLGYGHAYRYAHDEPEAYAAGEQYFPDDLRPPSFYRPTPRGLEGRIAEKLAHLRELDAEHRKAHPPAKGDTKQVRQEPVAPTTGRPDSLRPRRVRAAVHQSPSHARHQSASHRHRRDRGPAGRSRLQARRGSLPRTRGAAQGVADADAGTAGEAQQSLEADRPGEGEGRGHRADHGRGGRARRRTEEARGRPRRHSDETRSVAARHPERAARERPGGAFGGRQRRGPSRRHAAHVRLRGARSRRHRRRAGPARLRGRREDLRRAVHGDEGRARADAPGARAVHAERAHDGARLHRGLRALPRERRQHARHGAAAEVRGRPLRRAARRQREDVPDPHGRGARHEPRPRRDPRGRSRCR